MSPTQQNCMLVSLMDVHGEFMHANTVHMDFGRSQKENGLHTCRNPIMRKDDKVFDSNFLEREVMNFVIANYSVTTKSLQEFKLEKWGHETHTHTHK